MTVRYGVHVITLTVTDNVTGKTGNATITIDVTANPPSVVIDAPGAPVTGSAPLPVNFACTASGGSGNYSYSWVFGDGGTDTAEDPAYTYPAAGTYAATITVTDNITGKTAEATSETITVSNDLTVTLVPLARDQGGLEGDEYERGYIRLMATVQGGDGDYTWRFEYGDVGSTIKEYLTPGDANPKYAPGSTSWFEYGYCDGGADAVYTATVSVWDGGGLSGTAQTTVTIKHEDPFVTIDSPANGASGPQPMIWNYQSTQGVVNDTTDHTFGSRLWSTTPASWESTSQDPGNKTIYGDGTYTVNLTVTDTLTGHVATDSITVTVTDVPLGVLEPVTATPLSGPPGTKVIFDAQSGKGTGGSGEYEDRWYYGDGGDIGYTDTSRTYNTEGTYDAYYEVTDTETGETVEKHFTIVIQNFTATATANPTEIVVGDEVTFGGSVTGGTAPYTWSWDFETDAVADSTAQNPSHVYNTPGAFTATLTITDDNAATAVGTVETTVNAALAVTAVATPNPVDEGAPHTFGATATGGVGPYTWAWDFGDAAGTSTEQNPTYSYPADGAYTATVTVTDADARTATFDVVVTVNNAPLSVVADTATSVYTIDEGETLDFTAVPAGGSGTYTTWAWTFPGGTPAAPTDQQNPTGVQFNTAGTYVCTVTVTDSDLTTADDTVTIEVQAAGGLTVTLTMIDGSGTQIVGGDEWHIKENASGGGIPKFTITADSGGLDTSFDLDFDWGFDGVIDIWTDQSSGVIKGQVFSPDALDVNPPLYIDLTITLTVTGCQSGLQSTVTHTVRVWQSTDWPY